MASVKAFVARRTLKSPPELRTKALKEDQQIYHSNLFHFHLNQVFQVRSSAPTSQEEQNGQTKLTFCIDKISAIRSTI